MRIETSGSTQSAPVIMTTRPAITTPTEPAASDARWRNAPRRFRLSPLDRAMIQALPAFTARPSRPTMTTPSPSIGSGFEKRWIAS